MIVALSLNLPYLVSVLFGHEEGNGEGVHPSSFILKGLGERSRFLLQGVTDYEKGGEERKATFAHIAYGEKGKGKGRDAHDAYFFGSAVWTPNKGGEDGTSADFYFPSYHHHTRYTGAVRPPVFEETAHMVHRRKKGIKE